MDIWPIQGAPVSNEGCKLVDRWGCEAEGFMIGGMAPTSWFNNLVILGWAMISEDIDFIGESPLPFVGPDGDIRVTLLNGISQIGEKDTDGYAGDWVIKYNDDDIRIVKEKFFNYQFIIVDRGET